MKRLIKISLPIFVTLLILSCGEDRTYQYLEITEECQWIYSQMKEHYLWSDSIKTPARNSFFSKSEQFYKGLLLRGDKTSYFNDSTSITNYGFSYLLMRDPLGIKPSKAYALVTYVEPNSPAQRAGLKRGIWITGTKEKELTTSNHTMLISGNATTLYTAKILFDGEEDKCVWLSGDTLQIERAEQYQAATIPLDTIYSNNGEKTGYIILNNFYNETSSNSIATSLMQMSEEKINSIIIDLRYNNDTSLQRAVKCANMLAQSANAGKTFCITHKNNQQTESILFAPTPLLHPTHNILFLTSAGTNAIAQIFVSAFQHTANEQSIIVIGEQADCQPYITETFVSPYGFAISPTVATLHTADGKKLSPNSVSITHNLNEFEDIINIHPLGDIRETLLNKALTIIENK